MFAARICSRVACHTSLREIDVRRGSDDLDQVRRRVEADPVADGGQVLLANEVVGGAHAQLTRLGEEVVGAPMLNRDAGGLEPGGAVLGELGVEAVVPPEPVKVRIRDRKCQPMLLCVRIDERARRPSAIARNAWRDGRRRGKR